MDSAVGVDFRGLAFHLNFSEQWFVQLELLSVHLLLGGLRRLLVHLLLQESGVFSIDHLDLLVQTVFLILVVLLVARPQHCLLIVMRLRVLFTYVLLLHLSSEECAHLVLFHLLASDTSAVLFS